MSDRNRRFEIWIAAIGVLVTGVLGYGQWQLGQQQNQILKNQMKAAKVSATDAIEVQMMTLVSPHLSKLGSDSDDSKMSEGVILAAAEYLSEKHGRTSLAEMAARISSTSSVVSTPTKTRFEEASQVLAQNPTQTPSAMPRYFTVLASVPANKLITAQTVAREKLRAARTNGINEPIYIYKTKISNHLAIVMGGLLDINKARELAIISRDKGIAVDAFHQIDKQWSLVESFGRTDLSDLGGCKDVSPKVT